MSSFDRFKRLFPLASLLGLSLVLVASAVPASADPIDDVIVLYAELTGEDLKDPRNHIDWRRYCAAERGVHQVLLDEGYNVENPGLHLQDCSSYGGGWPP